MDYYTAMSTENVSHFGFLTTEHHSMKTPQIVSTRTREILDVVNYCALSGVVCLFGIISNIINCVIFLKQGLNTTFNISFFSLAISDCLSVIACEWTNIALNPLLLHSDIPWDFREIQYLSGAWPHELFGHITCWITAYMTAERCLCIAMPLKVKGIVTPRRTTFFMIFVYLINGLSFIPEYGSVDYGWKFYPERNATLLGLVFRQNREVMGNLGFIFMAVLRGVSFPAVVIFTAILVVSLRRQAKWRKESSATDKHQSNSSSKRDLKTMQMVVLIASILIICYTPGVVCSIATNVVPGFYINGDQSNLCFVMWSFAFLFEAINSSVNIFMYYRMSTKYRTTFHQIFSCCGFEKSTLDKDEQ